MNKLKDFAIDAYKNYTMALVNNLSNNKETNNNIAKDIINFIKSFHEKYGEKINIEKLNENLDDEKNGIFDICKNFIDLLFTDGDIFINYITKNENESKDNENSS